MDDRTFHLMMKALPKATLSSAMGVLVRVPAPAALIDAAIRVYARRYGADLGEAAGGPGDYRTFADFFGRRLKPGARPVTPGAEVVVSPVDGTVHNSGVAQGETLVQVKGKEYAIGDLLASAEDGRAFAGGAWATFYLAPGDYHRIHAPVGGTVVRWTYAPGTFWPVNPSSTRTVERLFARNERLITHLQTPLGRVAVVKVGATCVSRIRALYADVETHGGGGMPRRLQHTLLDRPVPVEKGGELGIFEMGSTVVVLFQPGRVRLDLQDGQKVRMGQPVGRALAAAASG